MDKFVEHLKLNIGRELHISRYFKIEQNDIDMFSDLTDDWDYMHNDPGWVAENGPWENTIAHGFFVLSRIPSFMKEAGFPMVATLEGTQMLNYGLDKVRFIRPVLVGDRIRARLNLADLVERGDDKTHQAHIEAAIETERCGDQVHVYADSIMWVVEAGAMKYPK